MNRTRIDLRSFAASLTRCVACAAVCALLAFLASCGSSLPAPGSEKYTQMVSAFFQGLAALEAGDDARAKDELTRASEIVPEEPAPLADLGLLGIRQRDYDAALARLQKASALAPKSAKIASMLGLLESSRGDSAKAIEHYQHALELDGGDVKVLYALAAEIERQGAEGSDARVQELYKQILAKHPRNLAVLLDSARVAARQGDKAALDAAVSRIGELATGWPEEARTQFANLQTAASGPDAKAAGSRVAFLRNVLVRDPAYQSSLLEVKCPPQVVGEPIDRFLVLENPSPSPAAPDAALSFAAEAPVGTGVRWAGAFYASSDGPATVAYVEGSDLVVGGARVAISAFAGTDALYPHTVAGIDFDYDFDNDIAVATPVGFRLVEQRSSTELVDVSEATTLPQDVLRGVYAGVWPADVDLDGDLDLVVARATGRPFVLTNNGDRTFTVSEPFGDVANVRDFVWIDLDDDGDPDFTFSTADGHLRLLLNDRGGLFHEGVVPESLSGVAALAGGDVDGDGSVDVVCLGADGGIRLLSIGEDGTASVRDAAPAGGFGGASAGGAAILLGDLDNNGAVDVVASSPSASRVWLGGPGGALSALQASVEGRVLGAAELTGDGRVDLVATTANAATRLTNKGTAAYHWQDIRPRAKQSTGDQRINSFGIGGMIGIRSGLLYQQQQIDAPVVHFGLGQNASTEVARIVWPNGVVQAEFGLSADTAVVAEQRLKGSCPWLFAWNGSEMAFVTDFIWRSPLGLRINAQETAGVMQTEDWVKIRADQLVARDGFYDLRITADLWETHFFDYLRLVEVDHPAGTDVFVDERFAVPPPRHAVIATAPPRPVVRAVDDTGRDVTDVVARADASYLDTFGLGQYQGVTRDHYVELELPDDVPSTGAVLLAYGWIHPTDSSINVAISQGSHAKPTGLSLEVQRPDGTWADGRTGLGFPEGKLKTVVLDLDGLFEDGAPRRLRLRTNLEIYWDSIAWATRAKRAEIATHDLSPSVVELRYRGFSAVSQASPTSPELPDYGTIASTQQRWRDLTGYYTRYGDVRELVTGVDDRYIIMNAGDEIVLRFPAETPLKPGWVRDFVLVGDGWVKDGDFNTTFSTTVLPLPSHQESAYDRPPTDLESDPVYARHAGDWQTYHTRYVTPYAFRRTIKGGSR